MDLNKPSWVAAAVAAFLALNAWGSVRTAVAALMFTGLAAELRRRGQ